VSKNVIVVGGGLAGLAAALYLARGGRTVTLFEKRRNLGGRAVTHLRHGFRFNLGPHGFYRGGGAARVYRELGVPAVGRQPKRRGVALFEKKHFRLPTGVWSILVTRFLTPTAKFEALKLFLRIRRMKNTDAYHDMSAREWLDTNVRDDGLRLIVEALMRLTTYCDAPERQSAAVALQQVRLGMKGVIYVDEGWQKLVDTLHSHCVAAGVNFVTSSRVVRVDHDSVVRGVELGGLELDDRLDTVSLALPDPGVEGDKGTRLPAETVVLAVDPTSAHELTNEASNDFEPVTLACLDVALSRLPVPKNLFAVGVDEPLYFSVHSAAAQLTPKGGALIHVAKYRKQRSRATFEVDLDSADDTPRIVTSETERELEAVLDDLQPGWRDVLVHRRYLPSMIVSNAMVKPSMKRPSPVSSIGGLYYAGDWVGDEGWLSDASLLSARAAAKTILSAE
jgi:phytoene dehydrogenase-like protein